jgi:16S rRNA (cytidine1402-2'-O)-methyltransferase
MFGKLYLIGSPIGNIDDISFTTIQAIKTAKYIAVENPLLFKDFCSRISVECSAELIDIAYEEGNDKEAKEYDRIIDLLVSGNDIFIISDEGMPGIADPGEQIVKRIIEDGRVEITSTPGPSAIMAAVSVAGCMNRFSFEGFLSHDKQDRINHLNKIKNNDIPMVFYIMNKQRNLLPNQKADFSDHIFLFLDEVINAFGKHKQSTLCYNLTRQDELIIRKNLGDLKDYLLSNDRIDGNCCIVIH